MSTSASPALEENQADQLPARDFKGHTMSATSVAYLKDGKRVISGSWDGTIRIWNVESGEQENESMTHGSTVDSIAISPDEKKVVSGGDGTILWDLESRAVMWKTTDVRGFRVAFSPDGQLIAAIDTTTEGIALLDVESGNRIREPLHGEYVRCLAFSPDGTRLTAGTWDGEGRVFDVATGEIVVGPFKAHIITVESLVLTLDGQQIITASWDKSIRVWNSANGNEVGEPILGHNGPIERIALSGDGRRIASVSWDRAVRIWDVSTGRQLGIPPRAQKVMLKSVAWSPSDISVVAGDFEGGIYLWDVPPLDDDITSTSRSRTNSLSSSILNLPAGPLPTTPPKPPLNIGPDEDDNWEFSTNESFDSVFDLPADGNQPAQRRKRRRRHAAPVASTSSPMVSAVPNRQAPPAVVGAPRHSPPLDNKIPSPPAQTSPDTHAVGGAPAPRVGALRGLWRQRRNIPRWTRRKLRKDRDEPRESQPIAPGPAPSVPASDSETQPQAARAASIHSELATDHAEPTERPSRSRNISRLLARSKRQPANTIPTPESIEMHPQPSAHRRTRNPPLHTRPRRRQPQSEVVTVSAGRMDQRMAASSNKWTDTIDWLDYICFCMCCPWNKVVSESDSERRGNRTAAAGAGDSSGSSSGSSLSSRPVNLHNIF
ncbi:quinon protein alcohol dehydrogenase-like superfamily [Hygrophoropsis aurantiaca]|uniref:Quinon protein alcohol dehydrogenase-like superfamily n=1 Tax=Hygrophoropsis aurantiaca TaxID=72124 RepID=A0ACB8A7G9_9AGAM|nr:quinon protein alcohol dehydrogenase-like superfamily [Hygrophoropsis aurantiaca]